MILFTQQMRIVSNIYATKSPTTNQNKFVQLKPNFHLGSNSTMILRISLWIFLLSLYAMETFTSFLYQTCINKDLACSKGVSCWAFWYKMRKKTNAIKQSWSFLPCWKVFWTFPTLSLDQLAHFQRLKKCIFQFELLSFIFSLLCKWIKFFFKRLLIVVHNRLKRFLCCIHCLTFLWTFNVGLIYRLLPWKTGHKIVQSWRWETIKISRRPQFCVAVECVSMGTTQSTVKTDHFPTITNADDDAMSIFELIIP